MDREEMRKLQSIRLRRVVEHVYHNSPFYRKKMQELGVVPQDIQSIDDITKLPFTVKQDLRDNYPFGLMAVPKLCDFMPLRVQPASRLSLDIPAKTWEYGKKSLPAA